MIKIAHLGDLHLGITMFGRSLEEDQRHIMNQITDTLKLRKPDLIVVAGDVYHSTNPPAWGMKLWSETVYEWSEICPVRIIPGNHDSAARLASNDIFLNLRDIQIYTEPTVYWTGKEAQGIPEIGILFVPHKPCDSPEEFIGYAMNAEGSEDACVMVAHHNFIPTDPKAYKNLNPLMFSSSPSAVPEAILPPNLFVLAGHIHTDWDYGNIAYSSSPLQYNFERSEANPGFGMLEINDRDGFKYSRIESEPLHKMIFIDRKTPQEILDSTEYDPNDYYRILLPNPDDIQDYGEQLREKLPNILSLAPERKNVTVIATAKATARDTHEKSFEQQVDAFCEYVGGDSPEILSVHSDYLAESH